ncbi:MAG TPA: hydantoinase/oxoprolinase family protein [Longimicrobiales bacterium]
MSIVAVDTGGTFTDVVYLRDGALRVLKVPSTPDDPARAVIAGLSAAGLGELDLLTHGSTVATNALLERRGATVALITNRGFEDVIEIGRQNRPHLYALSDARPAPLVARELRFGISGRLDYAGNEIEAMVDAEVVALKDRLARADAIAICLLHSYANRAHEERVAALLRDLGKHISISSALLPEYREYERTATTAVNAYVAPLMSDYLAALESASGAARVRIMGSGGGAVPVRVARREPVHTVLSGPAGGVAGALAAARAAGIENIISFDMGGTSTDVSLCPGRPLHTREFTIAGMPVAIPVLDIHTVGAGGGSVAWVDAGGALRVGPRSAGAQPGPICYGRGGRQVTVTDANVWLGRLPEQAFLGGAQLLDREAIRAPLSALAARLQMTPEQAAEGILTVVNSTIEGALRVISVERGYDPVDFTLVAFGGAAGLHAAELADRLGLPRVLLPLHPGLLSAYGMLASPVRKSVSRTVLLPADAAAQMDAVLNELEVQARQAMRAEGMADADTRITRSVDARYAGQSYELNVPAEGWIEAFHDAHQQRYGHADRAAVLEAATLRVAATSPQPVLPDFVQEQVETADAAAQVYFDDAWRGARVLPRGRVRELTAGPAVVTEYSATLWLPPGWQMERTESGALLLTRRGRVC